MTPGCILFSLALALVVLVNYQEAFAFQRLSLVSKHHRCNSRLPLRQRSLLPRSSSSSSLEAAKSCSASFESYASENPNAQLAVAELLADWSKNNRQSEIDTDEQKQEEHQGLAFLFVSQHYTDAFQEIVKEVSYQLGSQTKLLSLIGGGVVSGGTEMDDASKPFMSLLGGMLPQGSEVETFTVSPEDGEETVLKCGRTLSSLGRVGENNMNNKRLQQRPPSHVVFSDPFCTKIQQLLKVLDDGGNGQLPVVTGGISVPLSRKHSSIALQDQVLAPGSLVGVTLDGSIGLQAIASQGCRPVGPTFTITTMRANAIAELDSKPAIQQLEHTVEQATKEDQELVRTFGILGGVIQQSQQQEQQSGGGSSSPSKTQEDFLIRQVVGFRPQSGAFLVANGHHLKEGDSFRFHVRAADAALEDMQLMIQRAQTERLVLGSQVLGRPLGALQISCVARGKTLYGRPNVDVQLVQKLFGSAEQSGSGGGSKNEEDAVPRNPPIAGFFANGEIGPVGIRMGTCRTTNNAGQDVSSVGRSSGTSTSSSTSTTTTSNAASNTHLHGFTTVVAMLCDYSGIVSPQDQRVAQYQALMGSGAIVPPQLEQDVHAALLGSTHNKKITMEDAPWG
jgi:small ligand-binding sensory domain FIST